MNYNKISSQDNKQTTVVQNIKSESTMVQESSQIGIQIPNVDGGNIVAGTLNLENTDIPKEPIKYIVVNCNKLNVREKPSIDSAILCVLNKSETMLVEEIANGWAHVYTEFGIEGYIVEDYIKEA